MDFEPVPRWSFRLFRESTHRFHTLAAPRLFFRITQHLILGLVWERLEPRKPWYERVLDVLNSLFGDDGWSSTRHWRSRNGR